MPRVWLESEREYEVLINCGRRRELSDLSPDITSQARAPSVCFGRTVCACETGSIASRPPPRVEPSKSTLSGGRWRTALPDVFTQRKRYRVAWGGAPRHPIGLLASVHIRIARFCIWPFRAPDVSRRCTFPCFSPCRISRFGNRFCPLSRTEWASLSLQRPRWRPPWPCRSLRGCHPCWRWCRHHQHRLRPLIP